MAPRSGSRPTRHTDRTCSTTGVQMQLALVGLRRGERLSAEKHHPACQVLFVPHDGDDSLGRAAVLDVNFPDVLGDELAASDNTRLSALDPVAIVAKRPKKTVHIRSGFVLIIPSGYRHEVRLPERVRRTGFVSVYLPKAHRRIDRSVPKYANVNDEPDREPGLPMNCTPKAFFVPRHVSHESTMFIEAAADGLALVGTGVCGSDGRRLACVTECYALCVEGAVAVEYEGELAKLAPGDLAYFGAGDKQFSGAGQFVIFTFNTPLSRPAVAG